MMFAMTAIPLVGLVGAAIDYSNAYRVKERLQTAVDSAALAVARDGADMSDAEIEELANKFFKAHFDPVDIGNVGEIQVSRNDATVELKVVGTVPTWLLPVIGVDQLSFGAETAVLTDNVTAEIALVLDNSGSMSGSKISSLRTAARKLVDTLYGPSEVNPNLSFSLVPFSSAVNVGTQYKNASWIDGQGLSPLHSLEFSVPSNRFALYDRITNVSWPGCVETRSYPMDVNDTAPSVGNPETLFVPYFAPDEPDSGSYWNNYLSDATGSSDKSVRQKNVAKYAPGSFAQASALGSSYGRGPAFLCNSQPIMALTNNKTAVKAAIKVRYPMNRFIGNWWSSANVDTESAGKAAKGKGKAGKVFIVLDNIMRACLPQMFRGVIPIDDIAAYCFKFSRDAELELDAGIQQSLIDKMASSLRQRRRADAVRMVYDENMPQRLLDYISARFGFGQYDSLIAGGRYHNSKDFRSFPNVGSKYLEFKPLPPVRVPRLDAPGSIFETVRERDVLLYYPYHPFDYIVDLLKTAALDPEVSDIKICLYRVAANSRIIDALVNAAHNGKRVLAVVELAARFDEAANITWAQRLTESGITVLFGIPGLKVHSKLILIERKEGGYARFYSHIGTGNFNENTARVYTDFSLITYDQTIGKDVFNVFDFLQYNYRRHDFRVLLVSPYSSRPGLLALIDREIANVQAGYTGSMTLKCNNLVDKELVTKLYEASRAGVEIKLIIRGMCSLLPGVKEISENISAISIVDRYLEHPRAYVFYNRGEPHYLIGSADLMTRNLDFRVEVLCPVLDPGAQRVIQDVLDQQWHDNVRARHLDQNQTNEYVARRKGAARIRSQESIHRYLETGKLPRYPKALQSRPARRRRKLV